MSAPREWGPSATELARRHLGWAVWTSRPTATRTRTSAPPRNDGIWAATVEADSYAELDAKLIQQDQADATPNRTRI